MDKNNIPILGRKDSFSQKIIKELNLPTTPFNTRVGEDIVSISKLNWNSWGQILDSEQKRLVNRYAEWLFGSKSPFLVQKKDIDGKDVVFCSGLIDRKLSVLRYRGSPTHRKNVSVNLHFQSHRYSDKIGDINRSDIAHLLYDDDTTVYYVSNSSGAARYALLAFDIDAKKDESGARPKDALEHAYAVRDYLRWKDFCFIQHSTSGYGAYVYFILDRDGIPAKIVNQAIKDFCEIVSRDFVSSFDSKLDAIKGDIPIFSGKKQNKTVFSQGNLVRLPVPSSIDDLDSLLSLSYIKFSAFSKFISKNKRVNEPASERTRVPSSCASDSTPATPSSRSSYTTLLSLSPTRDTNARESCSGDINKSIHPSSMAPLKRVFNVLKQFRDEHQRDPRNFQEFNTYYENANMNTDSANPQRQERYNRALKKLGPYRPANGFRFDPSIYSWLKEIISEQYLKEFGKKKKQSLKMEELMLTQYVIGLATAYKQDGENDFGCPMTRIGCMHKQLHSEGKMSKPYGKHGRNRYGCYVKILTDNGLIEKVQHWDHEHHRARKLIVTEKDQVFGTLNHHRICKGRFLQESPGSPVSAKQSEKAPECPIL
jgi:hypothetical protein